MSKTNVYEIEGCEFLRHSESTNKLYLNCRRKKKDKCKASAVLDKASNVMTAFGTHSCVQVGMEDDDMDVLDIEEEFEDEVLS